ncbi:hypothetical protein CU102_21150 [Phyllobacterium brassicacearum]|uniref:Metallo-beta-lactamase domain-containing protein n=1 Tax=Phyllobacterium brassicacearum TaxID=314235 RepID=A0A2P7BE53_9HYPH|nr:MBL fold metallo-hydrolase [Phyllobacterium brassicacearum]PSH64756.1 hypothetical protein CU102_21150 [Phyllobacterium brassicacearum]TDQ21729.1 glyoxylase-like metal-dependent hydrolase (beta-lactamase superfamily II) [Phyllobacterium brassicacearum]
MLPIPKFSDFREIAAGDDWFKVYEITPDLYAISEQSHYESTLISLMIGDTGAILVDTGCGIGDLKKVVGRITDKPILVVNTHTHLDHLGSNRDFDEIMMFDHPLSRQVSEFGASSEQLAKEILADNLFEGPRPTGFKDVDCRIPPFKVARWLKDGDCIEFGGKRLSVLHTPGEAPDHICLLNAEDRILFSGDIILAGAVWTHLDGGSLNDLAASYERLMRYRSDFEMIMPSHNVPWIRGDYLPAIRHAANQVNSGEAAWELVGDPWGRTLRKYPFDSFSFITKAA